MITAGIDLSANPRKTGVATIEWSDDDARVTALAVGEHDDAALCDVVRAAATTGIDCPIGWPDAFVDYVVAHRDGGHDLVIPETRRPLTYRATDLHVWQRTGVRPLAVSAERIGAAAMRCAAILAMLTRSGTVVDRAGDGPVIEVYPAAALKIWGLPHRGYKGRDPQSSRARADLVDHLAIAFPWLDLDTFAPLCRDTDDALDAVLCAVIAGLARQGRCEPVPADLRDLASREGWIVLPRAGHD
ncbi:DUF429 domain-containing protein [Isoptericola sp. b408]|uniref:DUF429 domain-containing protein n=1 Tax=Isoptericola sp. b408 TaxID=3064653 RepID=UPI002714288E|nr:DUF429 domain-containing protein [Isoptericola sp. b408]MDO8151164.1 DUF429 domain-containing protein [Isoptericola sp. b408]